MWTAAVALCRGLLHPDKINSLTLFCIECVSVPVLLLSLEPTQGKMVQLLSYSIFPSAFFVRFQTSSE